MRKVYLILALVLLIVLLLPVCSLAGKDPRHAPNMYINWDGSGSYDTMTVDWYCEIDARGTYWAVLNWNGGYAGFQNVDGRHVILMSLWDMDDGTQPMIEYASSGKTGRFGGEGTGAQVFTEYDWQPETWYTMRIQVWNEDGKSCLGQWVRPENGDWELTAIVSYPVEGSAFTGNSFFQEDFAFNNYVRRCRVRNSYARKSNGEWDSLSSYNLSNTYFPTDPPTWDDVQWDINFDCGWGQAGDYVWVSSGGGGFDANGKTMPVKYELSQPELPECAEWFSVNCQGEPVATPTPEPPTPSPTVEQTEAPAPAAAAVEETAAPDLETEKGMENKNTVKLLTAAVVLLAVIIAGLCVTIVIISRNKRK